MVDETTVRKKSAIERRLQFVARLGCESFNEQRKSESCRYVDSLAVPGDYVQFYTQLRIVQIIGRDLRRNCSTGKR